MKQQWIDALRAAALNGTVQTFLALSRDGTERCAMGVLLDALSEGQDWKESGLLVPVPAGTITQFRDGSVAPLLQPMWVFSYQTKQELGVTSTVECPLCPDVFFPEIVLVMHLNDVHRMDFLTIANKLPVTPE